MQQDTVKVSRLIGYRVVSHSLLKRYDVIFECAIEKAMEKVDIKRKQGFTLIELSIVLVIISLVVGGVIGGKSLIRSAELNSVVTDFTKYTTAYNNFLLQFDGVPGDFSEAESYWPGLTTNGNGSHYIGKPPSGGAPRIFEERHYAWQHLVLAEMINGSYSGQGESGGYSGSVSGLNAPTSSIKGGGFVLSSEHAGTYYTNHLQFQKLSPSNNGILMAKEGRIIDRKMDDGTPHSGRIRGGHAYVNSVYQADCAGRYSETYNVSQSDEGCMLLYLMENMANW